MSTASLAGDIHRRHINIRTTVICASARATLPWGEGTNHMLPWQAKRFRGSRIKPGVWPDSSHSSIHCKVAMIIPRSRSLCSRTQERGPEPMRLGPRGGSDPVRHGWGCGACVVLGFLLNAIQVNNVSPEIAEAGRKYAQRYEDKP